MQVLTVVSVFMIGTVATALAGCGDKPSIAGGYVCRWSSRTGGGTTTETAYYCCIDGSTPTGGDSITCVNGGGWSTPTASCGGSSSDGSVSVSACGAEPTPTAPFSSPEKGSQCKNGVTGPATMCLNDVASNLFEVSAPEVVDRHNCWRDHVEPKASYLQHLEWNNTLARLAERWAAQCPSGHDAYSARELPDMKSPDHTGKMVNWKYVGQNICYATHKQSMSMCIDAWAAEQKDFTYGVGQTGPGQIGHYTQVVAERSTDVGCGWSYCPSSYWKYVQVCNYGPAGNFNGGQITPYETA